MTESPVAASTRAPQKSGPAGPAFGPRSKTRSATVLAAALAATDDFAVVEYSPRRLAGRLFSSTIFETAMTVTDGETGEMWKDQQLINHPPAPKWSLIGLYCHQQTSLDVHFKE